ncbi:hypothetical protein P4H65_13055, partial [Paenibacillus chitinolyticus]|uniref:hypothetical protein n=1 Tax=Paenibacillus chitinolyticus TaxID=79263 RepID=UPI002DBCCD41
QHVLAAARVRRRLGASAAQQLSALDAVPSGVRSLQPAIGPSGGRFAVCLACQGSIAYRSLALNASRGVRL